ncbi:MAG: hypothetical protein DDG60_05825 [Anaerolineae bacterium]|nr:MAG: hypothetical protein DDG60_05825 [Anaerolineae bacterium]
MSRTIRRLLSVTAWVAFLLVACSPVVTLITRPPEATPTVQVDFGLVTPVPPPTRAILPSPTPPMRLNPEIARGVEVQAWFSADLWFLEQLAADFNATNPWEIKLSLVSYPNLNRLAQAVSDSLTGDSHPDLVLALPEQLTGWRDALLDLTPYAAHREWGVAREEILPVFWEQSHRAGTQIGLPVIRSGRYLFYNVTWARELGFSAAPRTWDEFRAQACAANAFWKSDSDPTNDGFGGLALETFSNWQTPYGWIRAAGGEVIAKEAYHFADEKNAAALEQLVELRTTGCAWLPTTLTNFENLATRRALFITGSLADLPAQRAAFSAAGSADEWTLIAFPGQSPTVPVYGLDAALFSSDERRELAAWLFLRWLLTPEAQVRLARASDLFPVNQAAFDLLRGDFSANPQKGAAVALLKDAIGYPGAPGWDLASRVFADGFFNLFLAFPNGSVQSTLQQMDAVVNDLLK